jgi:hypothetical protein
MGRREELFARVRDLASGSPYAVVATPAGFDVLPALGDPRWHGLVSAAGLTSVLVQHVAVHDEGWETVDERRELTWRAGLGLDGAPGPVAAPVGTVLHRRPRAGDDHGWPDRLRYGTEPRWTLSPDEARALVRTAAGSLGMEELRPRTPSRAPVAALLLVALMVVVGGVAMGVVLA